MKTFFLLLGIILLFSFYSVSQSRTTTADSLETEEDIFKTNTRSIPVPKIEIQKSNIEYTNSIFVDVDLGNGKILTKIIKVENLMYLL